MKTRDYILYAIFALLGFCTLTDAEAQAMDSKDRLNSTVYVQQIGIHNQVFSQTRSNKNSLGLFQNGNANTLSIGLVAPEIQGLVFQQGYNNRVVAVGKKNTVLTTQIMQRGLHQHFIMVGNNSISENMQVKMKGKEQTVFIRNLKRQR